MNEFVEIKKNLSVMRTHLRGRLAGLIEIKHFLWSLLQAWK